jgi:RluA family pseudouridine synthase
MELTDPLDFFPDEAQQKSKPVRFDFRASILFEDENYVLVNKPPFVSTLEDRHVRTNILSVAKQFIPTAQVCHRLDKDTSGVLAIAKNPDAYREMSIQFEKRIVSKIYHAVANGLHQFDKKEVDLPILKQNDGTVKISRKEGKPALTWFTTLRTYRQHSLLECRPVTGRMHQIRIHLASIDAPITGDETYGGRPFLLSAIKRSFNLKKGSEESSFMKRMALHAYSLEFNDMSGNRQNVQAPYPKDFNALIRQLELNS